MKLFKCPWCGDDCVDIMQKSLFYNRFAAAGNKCKHCNKRFVPKPSKLKFFVYIIIFILTLIIYIFKKNESYSLIGFYLLLGIFFIIDPIICYAFRPIVRCADDKYQFTPIPIIPIAIIPIPIQASVSLMKKISLCQQNIFAISFTDENIFIAKHKDLKNSIIPVYIEYKNDGWGLGFLKPDLYEINKIPLNAQFVLMDRDKILTEGTFIRIIDSDL